MTKQLLTLLAESFDGPQGTRTYFLDDSPDSGLRRTLAKLSAADASKEVGGNSIAAHAYHVLFGCDAFSAYLTGDRTQRDWNQSWRVSTVTEEEWAKLQEELASGYTKLHESVSNVAQTDVAIHTALVAVAHVIYHLGSIKQKMTSLISREPVAV